MDGQGGRSARWLQAAERAGGDGPAWAVLLAGWIVARNLLEGVLERPHTLGFDGREEISAAMVFLHFPVFYLVIFAWTALLLHALTRRPLAAILRATALAFGVILVAPLVDAVVSRGAGYDLSYLRGFGSFLWRFWVPGGTVTEVSPGQRVEIVLACVLAGAYTIMAWRAPRTAAPRRSPAFDVIAGLAAAVGVYLIAALAGGWPALFARLFSGGAAAAGAYERVFRGGGLVPDESRRHALVMLLLLLPALPILATRRDPSRFRTMRRAVPWTRLVFYTGMVPAGVWLGAIVCRGYFPDGFPGPADFAAGISLTASMLAAFLAALAWNDLHDRESDAVNAPQRPLVSGAIRPDAAARLARAAAAGAAFLALCVSYQAAVLVLAILLLAWAYSAPPLRLKRIPGIATGTLAALALLAMMTGFSLFTREAAPHAFPRGVALALFLGITLGFTAKDLKDRPGDLRTGTVTLATLLAPPWNRRAIAGLVAVSFLLAPVFLRLGALFTGLSIVFAVAGAIWTLRARRPDAGLLVAFCFFAGLVLLVLWHGPVPPTSDTVARSARGEATMLVAEQYAREIRRAEDSKGTGDAKGATGVRPAALRDALRRILQSADVRPGASPADPAGDRLVLASLEFGPGYQDAAAFNNLVSRRPLSSELREASLRRALSSGDARGITGACDAAIRLGVRPGSFLRNRAAAHLASGDTGGVAADLRGALAYLGDEATIRALQGDLFLRRGEPARALRAYERGGRLDPDDPDLWAGRGEGLHGLGRSGEAVPALSRAVELRPSDPWYRNNLGVALRDAGRPAEARSSFEEAARLDPRFAEACYNLAILDEREGNLEGARTHLAEALRRAPGFAPAEAARKRISPDRGAGGRPE